MCRRVRGLARRHAGQHLLAVLPAEPLDAGRPAGAASAAATSGGGDLAVGGHPAGRLGGHEDPPGAAVVQDAGGSVVAVVLGSGGGRVVGGRRGQGWQTGVDLFTLEFRVLDNYFFNFV